ncbi:MAG: deoxyribodipyrimidine photo-lyase [Pseudoalteromonas tetraodonis]|jgi:deoxyribodipyrimidine photo-lyase
MKTIVWFREDLRLHDNPALHYAASAGSVAAIYVYPRGLGGASKWWLDKSLSRLSEALNEQGIELVLKTGSAEEILKRALDESSADKVVWNRVYSPQGIALGEAVKNNLGVELTRSFNGLLLTEPSKIFNKQGTPFKVFTPYWRYCQSVIQARPIRDLPDLKAFDLDLKSDALIDWGLHPQQPDWSQGLEKRWVPGEQGAQQRWQRFLDSAVRNYKEGRDFPATDNTSYLSAHLAFGEISANQLWLDTHEAIATGHLDSQNGLKFLSEIGWREYSRYLLVHFPEIETEPFNKKFRNFPWQSNPQLLKAWQSGQTGYPIVDAGMRELWHTGYMHNRVRMVVASFLTKHCLIHWREGADWFWDTLVDADIGSNTASWQWVAGCGADAAPYFRIFNPTLQSEKFDKNGEYLKRWLPELSDLPAKYIHKPSSAEQSILTAANVVLGKDYPLPIVHHAAARADALQAYSLSKQPFG